MAMIHDPWATPKFAWLVSNLIPKKTKKFEFRKKIAAILFEVKNNAYTQILNIVGVGVGESIFILMAKALLTRYKYCKAHSKVPAIHILISSILRVTPDMFRHPKHTANFFCRPCKYIFMLKK